MSNKIDIFQRMLAGGIIRNDEMGEAWEVVFRAQRLSPALKCIRLRLRKSANA